MRHEPDRNDGSEDGPVALTIAGSDSGGGAGLQADLKTFAAQGIFGTSVVTLVTAQNTRGVHAIEVLDGGVVAAQFEAVTGDLCPAAAKTGALGTSAMIDQVAALLSERPIEQLVVDPVMISKHGDALMDDEAFETMRDRLVPHGLVVTPNRFEAAALSGVDRVESMESMKEAARRIYDCGASHVVVKGGHFERIVRDILYDGTGFVEFGADRVDTQRLHGSGCVFSAAIAGELATGAAPVDAIGAARSFITAAIDAAHGVGSGVGPVNPMHEWGR